METDLTILADLSRTLHSTVLIKREDTQYTFSHKIRGAYTEMQHLNRKVCSKGVISGSAANFAMACAVSANKIGVKARAILPVGTPPEILNRLKALGSEITLSGEFVDDCRRVAIAIAKKEKLFFVDQTSDRAQIGYATIANEIVRQYPMQLNAIFVPVGYGTTFIGMAKYLNLIAPEVACIGVQLTGADSFSRSLQGDASAFLPTRYCINSAIQQVAEISVKQARGLKLNVLHVSESEVRSAMLDMVEGTRTLVEPDGALALAGLKQYCRSHNLLGSTVVALITGANVKYEVDGEFIYPSSIQKINKPSRKIFISYSRVDRAVVEKVVKKLVVRHDVWVDFLSLKAGERWEDTIRHQISSNDKVVVFLSQQALAKRGYFQSELRQVNRVSDMFPDNRIFVVPVLLDEFALHDSLERFHAIELHNRPFTRFLKDLELSLED
jgi:threonine dehydratase